MLELSRIVPRAYLELVLLRDFLLYALVVVAKMVVEPLHHSTAVIYSLAALRGQPPPPTRHLLRSEEHTSELQSHHDLVCRLLLEKKNDYRSLGLNYVHHAPTIASQINHRDRSLPESLRAAV